MVWKIMYRPPESNRVLLRPWHDNDLPDFVRLSGDATVMRSFPRACSREESDKVANSIIMGVNYSGRGF